MTEAEAATKWCPMVRINGSTHNPVHGGGADFTITRAPQNPYCIGSACMMWRQNVALGTVPATGVPDPGGYCGLAGKP